MNTQLFAVVGIAIALALVGAVVTESMVLSQHADALIVKRGGCGFTGSPGYDNSGGRCAIHGPA